MTIWEIKNELGLKKKDHKGSKEGYHYNGVVATGSFDALHDYNTGLLELTFTNPVHVEGLSRFPSVLVTTIDDGVWQGYGEDVDIDAMVEDYILNFGIKMPTEKEFNEFLNKYGIHGTYTG